jgi:hypothetical protein
VQASVLMTLSRCAKVQQDGCCVRAWWVEEEGGEGSLPEGEHEVLRS